MRRFASTVLVVSLVAGSAGAQSLAFDPRAGEGMPGRYDPYGQAGQYGEGAYDIARVVRVDPVFDDGYAGQRCRTREDRYDGYGPYDDRRDVYDGVDPYARDARARGNDTGRTVATVVGGVVGAVLGSKVGGGSGRYATSAIGTMVGGIAGREIYEASQRERIARDGRVTVCDPVPVDGYGGVQAYDVTYEYGGREYVTRTDYHPGDTIRVRVDVRPD